MTTLQANETTRLGIYDGVAFDVTPYRVNGFQLRVTRLETDEVLFNQQMIFYDVWEAVHRAVSEIWSEEIQQNKLWELPSIVVLELGLEPNDEWNE